MTYTYDDVFVVNSIDTVELERYEAQAISEVSKLGITDQDFIDRLSVNRTYMLACRSQYESDGMADKYKVYEKEYKQALNEAMIAANSSDGIHSGDTVWSVKVGRS